MGSARRRILARPDGGRVFLVLVILTRISHGKVLTQALAMQGGAPPPAPAPARAPAPAPTQPGSSFPWQQSAAPAPASTNCANPAPTGAGTISHGASFAAKRNSSLAEPFVPTRRRPSRPP